MNSQLGSRQVFLNCKQALNDAGYNQNQIDEAVLSPSYLRIDVPLNATSTLFNLPVLVNQTISGNAIRPNEVRLAIQDGFFVSSWMLYLTLETAAQQNSVLNAFPDQKIFATGGLYTAGATPLWAVYNGNLNLAINNKNIITRYPCSKFMQVPQTQQPTAAVNPISQFDGTFDCVLEPNILLLGSNNINLNLNLNGIISAIDANTTAVLYMNGILAQNISSLVVA